MMAALEDVDAPSWRVEVLNVVTKGGKIVRKVAERYLRDDISCSLPLCSLCSAEADAITAVKVANRTKLMLAESPRNGVYLLPSMKTALLRMDILEFSTKQKEEGSAEVFADVLVLETVWEYVRRQDLRVYDRLKALIVDRSRRFVPFANEHHRACFTGKKVTIPRGYESDDEVEAHRESEEERNERTVATTWKWYAEHLKELQRDDVKVVFLANDAEDLEHAQKYGVSGGVTIAEFLTPVIAEFPELQELLSMSTAEGKELKPEGVSSSAGRGDKQQLYPQHLQAEEIMAGIKSEKFFKGTLRCENWLVCHVLIHGANGVKIPVVVEGWEHINRAVHGDLVAIQMLPKDQWKRMSESCAGFDAVSASEDVGDETERQLELIGEFEHLNLAKQNVKPTGRVVGVIQRNWRKCCGSLEPYHRSWTLNASGRCLVVPVDRKMPKIKIQTRQQEALMGKRLLVEIDSWPADSKYPLGHYMRTLGNTGDELAETDVLLIEHDIASNQFSDEVMRCLPPEDWRITPQNSAGRRDLRRLPVVSIDPPNCCNIDDALHAKYLLTGNYEVGIHIADVTHFVFPGNALDKEAAARGISSYLVNRRCDMLPDLLTTSFTSLTANEEHFAFSVLLELKLVEDDVQVVGVDFCKSIIRSWASLSYSEAQCLIDHSGVGNVLNHIESKPQRCARLQRQTLGNSVKMLSRIAGKLRRKRREAGGSFDSDTEMRSFQDAKVLVEEFMMLADISVAKKIGQHVPLCSILRRHPIPSTPEVGSLVREARAVGVGLRVNTSKQLRESIDTVRTLARSEGFKNLGMSKLLRNMTRCCRKPASYFRSGDVNPAQFYHFGLAAPIYTHFTSPMRRYADLMVHRLLAAAIGVAPVPSCLKNESQSRELCEHLNKRHNAAQRAGRASVNLFALLHFQQYPTRTDAEIIKIKSDSVRVELLKFGIEGMIFLCDTGGPGDAALQFDPALHTLTLNNRKLRLFDRVRVKVYAAQTTGKNYELKLDLLDEHDKDEDIKDKGWKKAEANLLAILRG